MESIKFPFSSDKNNKYDIPDKYGANFKNYERAAAHL